VTNSVRYFAAGESLINSAKTAWRISSGAIAIVGGQWVVDVRIGMFGGMSVFEDGRIASDIAPLVFLGLVVGIGGVALIWAAIKGRNAPTHPGT